MGPGEESSVISLLVLMIMALAVQVVGLWISCAKPGAKPLNETRCSFPLPSENACTCGMPGGAGGDGAEGGGQNPAMSWPTTTEHN